MQTKRNIVVQVSDARISRDKDTVLVTYSLGSCIAVTLYDPALAVGGMIHYQLPDSKMDEDRARRDPFMFADSGLHVLINKMLEMGANKKHMTIHAAGGAAMATGPKGFDIGKRNFLSLRKVLWQYGIMMNSHDVGGGNPRNMYLDIETGTVLVKSNGVEKKL
ncbi:MAG: chemotaxis protein CheD [Phycisphaerae bacterium]|nr:chemotaxis protein CheD [Phycisphaerae bacterium]